MSRSDAERRAWAEKVAVEVVGSRRGAFDRWNLAVFVYVRDVVVYANRAAARLHDLPDPSLLVGQVAVGLVDTAELATLRLRELSSDQPVLPTFCHTLRLSDGSKRTIEASTLLLDTWQGAPVALSICRRIDDPTDESLFRDLFDHSPDGILLVDHDGVIRLANPGAGRLLGFASGELVGMLVEELVPEPHRTRHQALREAFMASPRARPMAGGVPFEVQRGDGRTVPLEIGLGPTRMHGQTALVVTLRDASARLDAEAREKAAANALRRATRIDSVGRLASGVAHDLNNLLTVMRLLSDDLRATLANQPSCARQAEEIGTATMKAAALTQQLLGLSQDRHPDAVDLDLSDVLRTFEPMLRRAALHRAVRVTATTRAVPVCADRSQLEQILLNLVMNARDATHDGDTIFVSLRRIVADGEAHAELCVRDTGSGMSDDTLDRLFEPFFSTKEDGTGLGLATVRDLVTSWGGDIEVDSFIGEGTAFFIRLPTTACDDDDAG